MSELSTSELLRLNLDETWSRLHQAVLSQLEQEFEKRRFDTNVLEGIDKEYLPLMQLAQFLTERIEQWFNEIEQRTLQFNEFRTNVVDSIKKEQVRRHMWDIAKVLGYSSKALKAIANNDAKWLDANAIYDRHIQTLSAIEQNITVTLQRLGDLVSFLIGFVDGDKISDIWQALSLHHKLIRGLDYHANHHVRIAAFRCLGYSLKALRVQQHQVAHRVPANVVQYVYRCCLDDKNYLWLRVEAITLVFELDPHQFLSILTKIFVSEPHSDLFLRARVVELLCEYPNKAEEVDNAIAFVLKDPSDYVRQRFAKKVVSLPFEKAMDLLDYIIDHDDCAKVRAQAYLSLAQLSNGENDTAFISSRQLKALTREQDDFALRTLLYTLIQCALLHGTQYIEMYYQALNSRREDHPNLATRHWLAQCREHLWYIANGDLLDNDSQQKLQQLALGQCCRIKVPEKANRNSLYRLLAFIGRDRYGFDVEDKGKTLRVTAGFKFGFRFWRFWYELWHSGTDKRQNHDHLKGRLYYGLVQTAPRLMAELSVTKVPGEPLMIDTESSWRDYLPLLDQVLSSLDQGWPTQALKIYSTHGITYILPPSNFFKRLYARSYIQLHFAKLAELRNYKQGDSHKPNLYIERLRGLGFKIWLEGYLSNKKEFNGNKQGKADSQVAQFFSVIPAPLALPSFSELQNYFYSVYQNSITQLIVFSCVATTSFLSAHIIKLLKLRRYRKSIPLVIGGWGTRGKSGTERLKAALFNAMGFSVVSKTTGCEAMFLYGPSNRPMKEMFLFRPYDKASIWEQVFVTELSSKLGADVFLWECMGLNPRYVDIIQNQWMNDDLSTITNCYPDHEDLHGPAGIEVPIVMQKFIPKKGFLLTSEESMLPLLQDAARRKNTALTAVNWLDVGLLCEDVIKRFPYEEHPNNIALVAKLAETLGVKSDFALKEMADNVVADLGVLKVYPTAVVRGRRLSFINGMSANERLGAIGNWQRTGLGGFSLDEDPDTWLGIVVNNRADRIARSKVFAAMLVNDMQADVYFFIGNNLKGLQAYIEQAWQGFCENYQLNCENFTKLCRRFRIPINERQVLGRLRGCLSEYVDDIGSLPEPNELDWQLAPIDGLDSQAISMCFQTDARLLKEYQQHFADLSADCKSHASKALDWLFEVFRSKWVVIDNYYSSGNQTINTMVEHIPPGLHAKIIGVQNIKGTGLDFVYRWQAWDEVHRHCKILNHSEDEQAFQGAVKALTTWEDFGLLDKEMVVETLAVAKDRALAQKELLQGELRLIEQRLEKQLAQVEWSLRASGQNKSSYWHVILSAIEAFLDAGDAVKRRKTADRIYSDLIEGLISYDKTSAELAKLNKAQKGGWLAQFLVNRLGKL